MKIVDATGQALPNDGKAQGELLVRGPWIASRYFKINSDPLRYDARGDGWFPTGDIATIDDEGFMQVTDRVKDVIKSGGEWIIDPLDGTTNFIHGFPYYCVSIALAYRGEVVQAVVYDPNANELFTATRGGGAFLNERPIRVGARDQLADGLIGTGFPFRDTDDVERYTRLFVEMSGACAGLRRPGACALDLANVAAGRLDGFFEQGVNAWDMAAGSLLITEAGSRVGDYAGGGDFLRLGEIVAGNPAVYAQMVPKLAGHSRTVQ